MKIIIAKYFILCTFFALLCEAVDDNQTCDKSVIFRIYFQNEEEVKLYNELQSRSNKLKLTMDRNLKRLNSTVIFRTSICFQEYIEDRIRHYNISTYDVETFSHFTRRRDHDDFYDALDLDEPFDMDAPAKRYLSSREIEHYVKEFKDFMTAKFPGLEIKLIVEGHSYEGRPIQSIFIGHKRKRNPIVFVDAGIHAREWHSRSLALYILRQLVNEAELGDYGLLTNISIIIVPNVNPDGYDYSLAKNKMWRKTRRPVNRICHGVDGNRNFDIEWEMGHDELNPCKEVYKGEKPFSEPETVIIRDIMKRVKNDCIMYISIHTYGNTIIYPYGYKKESHPKKNLLHKVATAGVDAVRYTTGSKFIADQSGTQLYLAAGGSDDYALEVIGIPFAYTLEIGPEALGFAVPVLQLKKTVFDGWLAFKAMALEAKSLLNK